MVFKKETLHKKNPREGEFVDRESFSIYIYKVRLRYINARTFYEYFGSHNTNYTSNLSLTFQNNIYTRWMIN